MGNKSSQYYDGVNGPICLKSFNILRSIGKGAFGKVSIVKLKTDNKLYALKYMCKKKIVKQNASKNVLREVEILKLIEFTYIVNLQYSFQDQQYMYMVIDLMRGGDVRFHINQGHQFTEPEVKVYIIELALALDYLHTQNIIHRDIKPDNLLLDNNGHIHISDFNIATVTGEGKLATSVSGTKPYMAPEILKTELGLLPGYKFEADWWSLGISLYEMMKHERPFTSTLNDPKERLQAVTVPLTFRDDFSTEMRNLLTCLLRVEPTKRLSAVDDLRAHMDDFDNIRERAKRKEYPAVFVPNSDRLNCEAIYELEEMITEANPLQKQRRKKINKLEFNDPTDPVEELSRNFSSFQRNSTQAEQTSSTTTKASTEEIKDLDIIKIDKNKLTDKKHQKLLSQHNNLVAAKLIDGDNVMIT